MSENLTVGAYGWRHDHWRPDFYDDELPEDWCLSYYANEFGAVLVPASYLGDGRDIEQWCEDVNENFQFYIEWPQQMDSGSGLLEELSIMGKQLGGILFNATASLPDMPPLINCPLYHRGTEANIWQPEHAVCSELAVFTVGQHDLRQQRQWLEAFAADSKGHGRAVLLSDPVLPIKKLRELKTLVELKGL